MHTIPLWYHLSSYCLVIPDILTPAFDKCSDRRAGQKRSHYITKISITEICLFECEKGSASASGGFTRPRDAQPQCTLRIKIGRYGITKVHLLSLTNWEWAPSKGNCPQAASSACPAGCRLRFASVAASLACAAAILSLLCNKSI